MVACIALSDGYIGCSLHGLITACAFGKRAMVVAGNHGLPENNKFLGFLKQFDLESWFYSDWQSAMEATGRFFAEPLEAWKRVMQIARPQLDCHWDQVRHALATRPDFSRRGQDLPGGWAAVRGTLLAENLPAYG